MSAKPPTGPHQEHHTNDPRYRATQHHTPTAAPTTTQARMIAPRSRRNHHKPPYTTEDTRNAEMPMGRMTINQTNQKRKC